MAENKQIPTVGSGFGASAFDIWTANLAQSLTVGTLTNSLSFISGDSNWKFCNVSYPIGLQNPDIQMRTFLTWDFLFFLILLFFSEKNPNLLGIQEHCIHKLGKIRSELKLLFGVYYWFLKLYTGIIWHLLPFAWDFVVKKIQTCWIYKNVVFVNWEKYEVSWNFCLVFIIDF